MNPINLISGHPDFESLRVTFWMNGEQPIFGVSCGSSFSEFYSEFSALQFFKSDDKPEIEKFIKRVNCEWFLEFLTDLAAGKQFSTTQIQELALSKQKPLTS